MKNVIVYLLGFPGTGKYTIAKEICKQASYFKLVDNHLINNPIFSLIDHDGVTPLPERVWINAQSIRDAVLDTMIHISPLDFSFVMTNMLLDGDVRDHALYAQIEAMVNARGALLVPVRLACSVQEMERRIVQKNRIERLKKIDPDAPSRYVHTETILQVDHPNVLDLDVSNLSPSESAATILSYVRSLL